MNLFAIGQLLTHKFALLALKASGWRLIKILFNISILGPVDLSRLNLQQSVWYLGKAAPMSCGYSP
ncbi:hypothetical protein C7Y70_04070 [Pseudoalteromonas sp. KS88]|nr:hypothetical protein C7Y70_04070 [Pseudoalteromonas sp. KS88]